MDDYMKRAIRLSLVVSLGGFLFGFDASVISGVIGFVVPEFGLDDWAQGLVVGAPTLAAIIGGITLGPLSDVWGRKRILQIVALLYAVSAIASALAPGFWVLVFARAMGGFAFVSLLIAPMYISETAPANVRGMMVSINQLNIMVGFSAAYFANYLMLQISGLTAGWVSALGLDNHIWRWMLGIEAIPALAYFFLLFRVPESPRWLVVNNRLDEAKDVLLQLMPANDIDFALQRMQEGIREDLSQASARLRELFRPELKKVFAIAIIVGIAQQITGINAVYFYAPSIFEQSGVGTDAAFAQAVWIGIINLVFTVLAMLLIDRLGRKPLLVAGLAGVFISMSIAAYGFDQATYQLQPEAIAHLSEEIDAEKLAAFSGTIYENDVEFKHAIRSSIGEDLFRQYESEFIEAAVNMNPWIVLIGIAGFVASFAFSLGPVMWVLFGEIFPNSIRGLAISAVGFVNSLVSFLVQFLFPWELTNLGTALTFFIYGLFAVLGLVLVVWLLPETSGKSLEELEVELGIRKEKV